MTDPNDPNSGVNLTGGGDVHITGDVAGRDKVTTNTTSTTVVNEGGSVARYAVIGVVVIAALALLIVAGLVRPAPATATLTPTAPATASLTLPPPISPSPPPATLRAPTETPTGTPTDTATASPTATASATATLPPGLTPSPTSALSIYDTFNDQCLHADRWALVGPPPGNGTATPTAIPVVNGCLQADQQFFTAGLDGRLSVSLSQENEAAYSLAQTPARCAQDFEVTLALNQVQVNAGSSAYLSVRVNLQRVSGDAALELRLRGGTVNGPLLYELMPRLIVAGGYQDYPAATYAPGQPLTLALRVRDVGLPGLDAPAGLNKRLYLFANGQPLSPPWLSVTGDACGLTLGYHADAQTLLDGYFQEVRLSAP